MATNEVRTDPHAAILTWLEPYDGGTATTWIAAIRAVMDIHTPQDRGSVAKCAGCSNHVIFTEFPCPTVRAIADALGVAK